MSRICILTSSALGSNPRVVKEANTLAEAGHAVHVISTRSSAQGVDQRDEEVRRHAHWTNRRLDRTGRGHRLAARASRAAARIGFDLTGAGAPMAHDPTTQALTAAALRHPADLYIAHYVAALPAAGRAAAQHGAALIFDAEDFHPGDLEENPENARANRIVRAIESRWLPRCAAITAASPGIADAYARAYGLARPTVVLNAFPRSRAVAAPTARGSASPAPTVYWFSQTIGPDRGLENAVLAVARSHSRPHLHLRGQPSSGYCETLERLATEVGIADRLHFHPPASPLDMERLAAAYDLGLASETGNTPNHKIALANKLFSYFLAGVPAVLSDTPGHQAFAEEAGGGAFLFGAASPEGLAACFDELLLNPASLAHARSTAWKLGQDRFNWEHEARSLLAVVEAVLAARPIDDDITTALDGRA